MRFMECSNILECILAMHQVYMPNVCISYLCSCIKSSDFRVVKCIRYIGRLQSVEGCKGATKVLLEFCFPGSNPYSL